MDSNYSLSDLAAVFGNREGGLGGMGLGWLIILFLFFMKGGWGSSNGSGGDYVTSSELSAALAGQTSAMNQQAILISSQQNNYETARLIDQLGASLMAQNNANTINVVQGFNALSGQITNQTNVLAGKLDQLGFQMENCCCSIKTLIKDNQIADLTNQLNMAQNTAVNNAQSLYLLSQLGKYTPGAAAAGA